MKNSRQSDDMAVAISEQLFELALQFKLELPKITEEFDLPPMQGNVMHRLQPGVFINMNSLAKTLHCDASNVTGIIDRLEHRGLVERRYDPTDRRTKLLGLTPAGLRLRKKLLKRLFEPTTSVRNLSMTDKQELYNLLSKVV